MISLYDLKVIFRTLLIAGALLLAGCSKPELIVLDSSGIPLQGAKVVGTSLSVSGQATFTDKGGKAHIPRAVQETKWISIFKPGYVPVQNLNVGQKKPIVIRMTKLPNT